jgi:hypothetical protein
MKNMKTSTMKKVVVKCGEFWTDEHDIDSEIFDDVYVEAATRSIERLQNTPDFKVTVVIDAWEKKDAKKPEKHFCYNTYRILLNAAMHEKAENLRQNFLRARNLDLATENLRGDNESSVEQPDSGSLGQ